MRFKTIAAWLSCLWSIDFVIAQDNLKPAIAALQSQLSPDAVVTIPWDSHWQDLQVRCTSPRISPDYTVVVEVATEADVQATVTFASRYNIPFLAAAGNHGWTKTLNKLPYGIQINLRKLNSTTLSSKGDTAAIAGGTIQYEITRSLFAKGKYAVAGPLLGGGHSLLQGQHGYALDNLVSARVVLANGTLVRASRTENADLFWAIRGAGHNFGIVTSLEVKAYDIPSNWTVYSFVYPTEKVEELFRLVNKIENSGTTRPAKLALTGIFVRIPAVDANNAVVAYTVAYEGSEDEAAKWAAQFAAVGPISTTTSTNVNYVDLYTVTGNSIDGQVCQRNKNGAGAGVSLPAWDLTGLRKAFTIFSKMTADPRFNSAITLLENYGMQGVRAVDSTTTALALEEREYPILASPVLWWEGVDEQTTKDADAYMIAIRNALYTGLDSTSKKRHAYVNYANGDEPTQELYGYDSRLEKLKELKKLWDPENRFGFYNPLV
ncbi:hypothetical protein FB567DRAFT_544580 [Paraphoma chrysanthemicola]|uniref:FAD-binding PCMH-type domain-containing protein n=1 Tax=Paraphoma chrysanthemicola TaxID=798071 RepID=A0A8K0W389_9PLEO|nr:hypothetical protein FB567DRAFT_544580 [Paraphoma chrysanthemicola]